MPVNNRDLQSTTPHQVRLRLYRGLFSRLARRLGVNRSLVSRVARGKQSSQRVQEALMREICRIERLARRAA
ncbi:MAG: hypothetical protein ACRD2R_02700 [Terriglobales bacterium]